MTERYAIEFDVDSEGDDPRVFIRETGAWGYQVLEVFEDPTLKAGEWSWEDEDWEPGPFAKKVLRLLNNEES